MAAIRTGRPTDDGNFVFTIELNRPVENDTEREQLETIMVDPDILQGPALTPIAFAVKTGSAEVAITLSGGLTDQSTINALIIAVMKLIRLRYLSSVPAMPDPLRSSK